MSLKNSKDHWAFLDEIEAPMWVDLTVEDRPVDGTDDEWFYKSHPFHQCSSRQLKLAFSRIGEESGTLELDLLGESSPTLPPSVSRSRGKDYKSKSWKGDHSDVSCNGSQAGKVKGKSSGAFLGAADEIKPNLSVRTSKGTSSSKASLVPEISRNVEGKLVKPVSACVDPVNISTLSAEKSSGSNAGSIITSENIPKEPKSSFEVSSRAFGQTSGILKELGISLRKSYITRQAARVEINADKRVSRGRKSSSGKSSTGSSSYPFCVVQSSSVALGKKIEQTPDSRNVARKNEAAMNGVKVSKRSNSSGVYYSEGVNGTKPTTRETSKSKVQNPTLQSKPLLSHRVNEQHSIASGATKAGGKLGISKMNKPMAAGKENSIGNSVSQACNRKANATGSMDASSKGTKPRAPWKGGGTRLAAPKQDKVGPRKEGKKLTNTVHLR